MSHSRDTAVTNTSTTTQQRGDEVELETSPRSSPRTAHAPAYTIMGAAESSSHEASSPTTATPSATTPRKFAGEQSRQDEPHVHVSLTYAPLDATQHLSRVKSPKAGAVVLFAGCTRDSFSSRPVTHLAYSTYAPLALQTLSRIACAIKRQHGLSAISITHRLGQVDIGEESILIAVSAPHRKAAWEAGEACLEDVKRQAEIWKEEWFADGGVWRSNRDGQEGVPVRDAGKRDKGKGRTGGDVSISSSAPVKSAGDVLPPTTTATTETTTTRRRRASTKDTTNVKVGIKKAVTEPPARPKPVTRTTTFYEGGFEI